MRADVPTMLMMIIASSTVMAIALALAGWRQRHEGMGCWALGLLLHAVAYVLLAQRGKLDDALTVVLANVLVGATFSALLTAIYQFRGLPWPWLQMVWPVATLALVFSFLLDSYLARVIVGCTVYVAQIGQLFWALRAPSDPLPGRGPLLIGFGMGLQAVILAGRIVGARVGALEPTGLHDGSTLQTATFLCAFITVLSASLGFIFMTKDRLNASNQRMASTDPLTGVANRRSLIDALERDLAHAQRAREPLAVMMVDVDHFKQVNDQHGHLAGDHVLQHVVSLLHERLRSQDLVGRFGGEEFLLLLPQTDAQGAQELAQSLCERIAQSHCTWEGKPIPVTVSIGMFAGYVGPNDRWDMLVDAADQAMYQAKQSGRNRVEAVAECHMLVSRSGLRDNVDSLWPTRL
jgi:diguanylate cyclase (GGDEF)-like protein